MSTESSVVVALREVRRLEIERQRREEEARQQAMEAERAQEEAAQRASIQYGPGMPGYGNHWAQAGAQNGAGPENFAPRMRQTAEVMPLGPQGFMDPQAYAQAPGGPWDMPYGAMAAPARKSSYTLAGIVLALCVAGAGFGYIQLNKKADADLRAAHAERAVIEQERNEAVAARAKAEQELKLKVGELETKLAAAEARINANSAMARAGMRGAGMAAQTGNGVGNGSGAMGNGGAMMGKGARAAKAAMRAERMARRRAGNGPRSGRRAAGMMNRNDGPAGPAAASAPKVAKKRKLTDDPLGGLAL